MAASRAAEFFPALPLVARVMDRRRKDRRTRFPRLRSQRLHLYRMSISLRVLNNGFATLATVYYRLETWGNRGRRYRFYCNVAIAHSPSHIQHFEATNPDAFQAMTKVLQDVEEWRSRR